MGLRGSRRSLPALVAAILLAIAPVRDARANGGVVVAADRLAAEIGADVLRHGGNAADAAIATAFALVVTYPQAGNLGGGGFLLSRPPGGPAWELDFRERAPLSATPDMFTGADGLPDPSLSRGGALSVGVPGTVAGLLLAHRRFGSRPLAELVAPAIQLAEDGFEVPPGLAEDLAEHGDKLRSDPYTASLFTRGGRPLAAGERLVQPDLAATLRRIVAEGESAFYRGPVAEALSARIAELGGRVTRADLAAYRPEERAPLRGTFEGHEVLTFGPPSAGGIILLQVLGMLEPFDRAAPAPGGLLAVHRLATAMQIAFAERSGWLGDPDYVEVPTDRLISTAHIEELRRRIPPERAASSDLLADRRGSPTAGGGETTHISVIDANGGAASLTTTLNSSFGSGIAVPGWGFLLNNEMDDFATAIGQPNLYGLIEGEANAVAPGKRMVSSMSPTIVLDGDEPWLVLGSPGGSLIPTAVVQVIRNVVVHGMDPAAAVAAPRIHHQWQPDVLQIESGAVTAEVEAGLRSMGYEVEDRHELGSSVMLAVRDPRTGAFSGAADPRRYGVAVVVVGPEAQR